MFHTFLSVITSMLSCLSVFQYGINNATEKNVMYVNVISHSKKMTPAHVHLTNFLQTQLKSNVTVLVFGLDLWGERRLKL